MAPTGPGDFLSSRLLFWFSDLLSECESKDQWRISYGTDWHHDDRFPLDRWSLLIRFNGDLLSYVPEVRIMAFGKELEETVLSAPKKVNFWWSLAA